jgi:hypothetical protein
MACGNYVAIFARDGTGQRGIGRAMLSVIAGGWHEKRLAQEQGRTGFVQ